MRKGPRVLTILLDPRPLQDRDYGHIIKLRASAASQTRLPIPLFC